MAKSLLKIFHLQKNKISIIPSWSDVKQIKPLAKTKNWFIRKHKLNKNFVVLYWQSRQMS